MSVDLDFTPTAARGGKRYLAEISALSLFVETPVVMDSARAPICAPAPTDRSLRTVGLNHFNNATSDA